MFPRPSDRSTFCLIPPVELRRMAILAECDICGNQHRVKDGLVGNSIRCKDCGVMFEVPKGPSISAETYLEVGGRLRLREPGDQGGTLWPRLVAGLVASLIIGALAGSIWAFAALVRPIPKNALQDSPVREQVSSPAARTGEQEAERGEEQCASDTPILNPLFDANEKGSANSGLIGKAHFECAKATVVKGP